MQRPNQVELSEDIWAAHCDRIANICQQVINRQPGKLLTIQKNTSSHTVRAVNYKQDCHPIDVSSLNHILKIDREAKTALVEGQVLLGDLCRATLSVGLLPAVIPEYSDFTVSGLINGEGIQSSSHRYGLFSDTILSQEVILGDGSAIATDSEQHANLFRLLFNSHGTLGIVTAATIHLIDAAPYVKSSYQHFRTIEPYIAAFERALNKTQFMEGVVYGSGSYVLIATDFVSDIGNLPVFHPQEDGNPYYYQHVKQVVMSDSTPTEEVIPTAEYIFRSMRGLWWMTECIVGLPMLTDSRWGRQYLDREIEKVRSKYGFSSPNLTSEERERCLVNQDMGMKLSRLREGIEYVQQNLNVYPIWNCAVKVRKRDRAAIGEEYVVDVGIYGEPMVPNYRNGCQMRALQQFVDYPALWGVSYLTRMEIHTKGIYDYQAYENIRQEYKAANAFVHLDDKIMWFDTSKPDPGKIPLWRLHSSYGRYWYLKFLVLMVILVGLVVLAISI
ncbi:MAG: FAD-binding oxidoreductase [Pseudanabaena sp. RU_4_16]|nr:FAD-binding oxidoreductase [Pseudanabaena sp. RU_4_16]